MSWGDVNPVWTPTTASTFLRLWRRGEEGVLYLLGKVYSGVDDDLPAAYSACLFGISVKCTMLIATKHARKPTVKPNVKL